MSEKFPDPNKPTVIRRLFSMYPSDEEKLQALAKHAGISKSNVLRELICVAFIERILQKKETPCYYGLNSPTAGEEPKKW